MQFAPAHARTPHPRAPLILVVGATGMLGLEICRRLREQGRAVRALVRPGSSKEAALREVGVEIHHGDLRTPSTLAPACDDVTTVVSTATAMGAKERGLTLRAVDRDGQLALVELARLRGVSAFVFISASPNLRRSAPLFRYKREVERAVRTSGMRWTIVQPSAFMDVWFSKQLGWDHVTGRAVIFGPGTAPVSWICIADVARHVLAAIDDPRVANVELPLGGPEALSGTRAFSGGLAEGGLLDATRACSPGLSQHSGGTSHGPCAGLHWLRAGRGAALPQAGIGAAVLHPMQGLL